MLIRVCDVETTGIDDPAEMVEIGWTDVGIGPNGWTILSGPHSRLVNPGMPIAFPAMAVHHITPQIAGGGMPPDEARQLIVAGADYLCAHNWAFDGRFIRSTLPAICTFKAARTAWPELQGHGNGSIRYERGLCVDDERALPAHRAGPDTWVTAHILLELLTIYSVGELVEITRNPVLLTKVPFGQHYGKRFSEIDVGMLDWIVKKMAGDPTKEDAVFTARTELARRQKASQAAQNRQGELVGRHY